MEIRKYFLGPVGIEAQSPSLPVRPDPEPLVHMVDSASHRTIVVWPPLLDPCWGLWTLSALLHHMWSVLVLTP